MKPDKSNYAFSILTEMEKQLPFFLIGTGYYYEQEEISRPFGYPYYQWIEVESGRGRVVIGDNEVVEISEGQGFLLFPEVTHFYRVVGEEPWIVSWFTFAGHHIGNLLKTFNLSKSGVYHISHQESLRQLIGKAYHQLNSSSSLKFLECSSIVYSFILALYMYTGLENDSLAVSHGRLQKIFDFIDEHYKELITINDLAAVLKITPQYLCSLFKRSLKMRPFEYLNIYRINKSKTLLLQHTHWPVSQVAKESGYDNVAYFSSIFKKTVGVTPSHFRNSN